MEETISLASMVLMDRRILCGPRSALASYLDGISAGSAVYFCNVHMLMLSRGDPVLAQAMDAAEFVFPDGVPVAWLQRRLGQADATVLRGYEAMELVCERAARNNQTVGIFGGTDKILEALSDSLLTRFPGLRIVLAHAPPMIEEDSPVDPGLVEMIQTAAPHFLFVSLGCPKQEKWIHRYREHLNCAMLGVGAAFGWLAGTSARPPAWMERLGLVWLFRLVTDPRRTARRYFVYNTQFLLAAAKMLLFRRNHDGESAGS